MPYIWKHPESKYWHGVFKAPDGRRISRSTRTTKRREAKSITESWERAARLAASGKLTRERAREVIDELMVSVGQEPAKIKTTRETLKEWLADLEGDRAEQTSNRYGTVVKQFLEHLGAKADNPVTTLGSAEIAAFIGARTKTKAAKTAANDLRCLSAAFSRAVRLGILDRNPCLPVPVPKGVSLARKPFSPEQVKMLCAAAPSDEWRTLIAALWFTGLRLGDASTLEWAEVDLAGGVIRRVTTKTGAEVAVPLHPDLQARLEAMAGEEGGRVFPTLSGFRPGGKNGLSAQFAQIVRAAGLDEERHATKAGRTLARYSTHSLRHGIVSALADAGVSPELRKKLVGHADDRVHEGYSHHAIETLRAAMGRVPGLQ